MLYSELLLRLREFGVEQVGRLRAQGGDIILLGQHGRIIFPIQVDVHPIFVEPGEEEFEVHPEVLAALLRRFGIDPTKFEQVQHPPRQAGEKEQT